MEQESEMKAVDVKVAEAMWQVVTIWWEEDKGWCVKKGGESFVYVFGTKRSAMTYAENVLDQFYGGDR